LKMISAETIPILLNNSDFAGRSFDFAERSLLLRG
jgi:hypothetical protein